MFFANLDVMPVKQPRPVSQNAVHFVEVGEFSGSKLQTVKPVRVAANSKEFLRLRLNQIRTVMTRRSLSQMSMAVFEYRMFKAKAKANNLRNR